MASLHHFSQGLSSMYIILVSLWVSVSYKAALLSGHTHLVEGIICLSFWGLTPPIQSYLATPGLQEVNR